MLLICPKCNSHIQEENIDNEENTCFCSNCEKTFDLSYLLNTEEMEQIEEIFTNPPKDIKIEKDTEKINVKFYIHSLTHLSVFAFVSCQATIFSFLAFCGTHIFRKEIDFNNLISTSVWFLFLFVSIWLLYKSLYTAFGRIELVFGKENYIFQGFWRIGKNIDLDWKDVKDFYPYYLLTDGEDGQLKSDYLHIIEDKKISLEKLGEKTNLLVLIIKYFRYKAISESLETGVDLMQPVSPVSADLMTDTEETAAFCGGDCGYEEAEKRWQEDTIESYNNSAKDFSEKTGSLTIYNITYDYLIKLINENDNILDLACGSGQISKYIKERINVNITGIDLSAEMLKIAKENIPDGTFIEDSIITFKSDILYDFIIIGFGIPYLNKEQTIQCIENSISLLKKNGHIYLSFMDGDSEGSEKTSFGGDNNFYIYYHKNEEIKEILLKNRMEIKTEYNIEYKEADGRMIHDVILITEKV